ncbi:hypothetical protein LTR78_004888 [Recurvomyces mirabilis]|uniref:Uncharacterized protein n=1 Tax=Recurvomyces mirabilis TaxID=574656 RepID=A0AAE1C278_9PEZI|nr:hypothetical protein LTR78_004888 [Recurvomyces mirabilis]KAK5158058.1 hypothetical protein LTS14_003981 [Recurvomyces mirabilis]
MSGQQPNAWQTAGRPRHSHSASRTPQSRSGTASPSQQNQNQNQPSQQPRQDSGRPQQANSVWTQRSSSTSGSNGQATTGSASAAVVQDEAYVPANGFNAVEVKAALGREAGPAVYKVNETARGNGNSAWGAKSSHMANNQPFFTQLAKQIATLEGGG